MNELTTDVIEAPSALDASTEAVSAPADSGEGSTPQEAAATTPVEKSEGEAAAPFVVPETDDDLKGRENEPQVVPIIQLRRELRERDQRLDSYKPLDAWKPVVETIGDPTVAQSHYEIVSAIHTPDPNSTTGFTSLPFLERIDQESPGTVKQIWADIASYQISDEQDRPSTVIREAVKSWGLDPDRLEDYRNIDTLRASSGVVTAEQLAQINPRYHDAFKSLSQATREDLLALKDTNPISYEEYLSNAQEALETKQWREQNEKAQQAAQEQADAQFEQQLAESIQTDLFAEVKGMHDSIHQELAAKVTFSSDPTVNALEQAKVMATLATLQNPAYRFVAENALKAVGVDVKGFDELANRWEERRSAYTQFLAIGDKIQAQRALSESTVAKQQMLIKLGAWAQKLAKTNGERLATAASQQTSQLAAASARYVPAGQGAAQQGNANPYMNNPHPVGSQEYYAYNKQLDREYKLTGASMFGN